MTQFARENWPLFVILAAIAVTSFFVYLINRQIGQNVVVEKSPRRRVGHSIFSLRFHGARNNGRHPDKSAKRIKRDQNKAARVRRNENLRRKRARSH